MKLLVIGDADTVLGFALIGALGRVVHTAQEIVEALDAAAKDSSVGVVLITEEAAALAPRRVDAFRVAKSGQVVVEIPGPGGPVEGRPRLRDVIARATGVRI